MDGAWSPALVTNNLFGILVTVAEGIHDLAYRQLLSWFQWRLRFLSGSDTAPESAKGGVRNFGRLIDLVEFEYSLSTHL